MEFHQYDIFCVIPKEFPQQRSSFYINFYILLYGRCQSAEDAGVSDTEKYPYYRYKELNTLSVEKGDHLIYGQPVRSYWHKAETAMIRGMSEILQTAAGMNDTADAKQYITDYCNAMQDQAFADAGQMLNDVRWYHSHNSNTMKNGINPETHEVTDELKPVPLLTVTLDATLYQYIPPIPGGK